MIAAPKFEIFDINCQLVDIHRRIIAANYLDNHRWTLAQPRNYWLIKPPELPPSVRRVGELYLKNHSMTRQPQNPVRYAEMNTRSVSVSDSGQTREGHRPERLEVLEGSMLVSKTVAAGCGVPRWCLSSHERH
jgi:hypothetical protein